MSGDLLVMKLVENETTEHGRISSFVFYDYKTKMYGVRCGYGKKNGDVGSFSYYVENNDILIEFLMQLADEPNKTVVTLMNFNITYGNPDNITYEYLKENDKNSYEISGYTYNEDFEDVEEEEDTFPREVLRRYLSIMENVYNGY